MLSKAELLFPEAGAVAAQGDPFTLKYIKSVHVCLLLRISWRSPALDGEIARLGWAMRSAFNCADWR